ncbi:hypothetical protein LCGC14_0586520 [marine sediment metagenome]|uniref:Uncharacterized protein n=1 Tax=marine sediment metagenome TaxID=412755 RepID=A0A0F9U120_9ZZZZ
MDITVDVGATIRNIEKEKGLHIKSYERNLNLYHKKLTDYSRYISKQAKRKGCTRLKQAPFPPENDKDTFNESIRTLRAHVKPTITMSDDEYGELMEVVRRARGKMVANVNALRMSKY